MALIPVVLAVVAVVGVFADVGGSGGELDFFRYIQTGGVVAVLLVLIWAILTRRLVPGWALSDCEKREAEWRELALSGAGILERQTGVLEAAADRLRLERIRAEAEAGSRRGGGGEK